MTASTSVGTAPRYDATSVSSLPDVRWEQLLQSIEEGRVIPVVGRGLLNVTVDGVERRLYDVLAERLSTSLGVPPDPAAALLSQVASRYLATDGEIQDVSSALKRITDSLSVVTLPAVLAKLAEVPFPLYVTTTFDPLLERAINQVRFAGTARAEVLSFSIEKRDDIPAAMGQLERPTIYHLLGRVSTIPDFAVTDEDLLEFLSALQSRETRPARLFDEMGRNQLLILGCEFPDWLSRFVIRAARGRRLRDKPWNALLVEDSSGAAAELAQFLQRFSAHPVVLSDSVRFVDELHARWLERRRAAEASPATRPRSAQAQPRDGAIFLSYASEDRDAAKVVRDALEQVGLDVWFDKDDLEAGDDFASKIRVAIARCSVFVPVISRNTLTPDARFFRREWVTAQEVVQELPESRRFVVPVVIDATSPSDDRIPQRFRALHWEALPGGLASPPFVDQLQRLYRDHQKLLAGLS